MNFFGIATFCLLWKLVYGWHDEAHMIIAAVAKLQLSSSQVKTLEKPLKLLMDNVYPEFNSLIKTATWADFIKTHEHFTSLNSWHYVSMVWNPERIQLSDFHKVMPYPGTGAVFALSTLFCEELPSMLKHYNAVATWNYSTPSKYYGGNHDVALPGLNSAKTPCSTKNLSLWSWNIKLRYLIHVFGDIHQPLHAIEMFSTQFPNGTLGGCQIPISYENKTENLLTLHDLWDSCGDLYNRRSYEITEDDVTQIAKTLINDFPFYNDDVDSFSSVARESYDIGKAFVYQEFMLKDPNSVFMTLPYIPSLGYIKQVRHICKKRLVFAGYRLSKILKDISVVLEDADWESTNMSQDKKQESVSSVNKKINKFFIAVK